MKLLVFTWQYYNDKSSFLEKLPVADFSPNPGSFPEGLCSISPRADMLHFCYYVDVSLFLCFALFSFFSLFLCLQILLLQICLIIIILQILYSSFNL